MSSKSLVLTVCSLFVLVWPLATPVHVTTCSTVADSCRCIAVLRSSKAAAARMGIGVCAVVDSRRPRCVGAWMAPHYGRCHRGRL